MVATAALLWSTAGLFVRALDLDVWTILVWRSLFAAAALLSVACFQEGFQLRRAARVSGWPGLLAVVVSAVSMVSYVAALKLTTVANVLTIYATVPFVAAGLAFLAMGERADRRVLRASAAACCGIVVMAASATRASDVAGDVLAFVMTLTFCVILVMARRYPAMNVALVNAGAALLCGIVCWPLMTGRGPDGREMAVLALFGASTTALAYLLFLMGGRLIPSGEAGLLGLLDVVLGPLWVWLAFAEQPSRAALAGAACVLGAVAWYLWRGPEPTH